MTLYAPPTDRQAYNLIARRLFLGRPAVMALCVTAFVSSIVTSGHSTYAPATIPGDEALPAESKPPVMASAIALPVPTALSHVQEIVPALPTRNDADALIRAAIKAVHPRFEAHPLPDSAFGGDIFGGASPGQPAATIRMASLVPPGSADDFNGERLFPRMPDTASLSILPPSLETHGQHDHSTGIDTHGGEAPRQDTPPYSLESVTAEGGETLAALLDDFNINEDDKRSTLVALRADKIAETLADGDRIDMAFMPDRALGTNELVAIRLDIQAGKERRKTELRWDGEIYDLWASLPARQEETEESYRPVSTTEALGEHLLSMGEPERVFLQGVVKTSLYKAADDAGMTPGEAKTLTDIFRYLVDFERDLRAGDRFEVLFDKKPNGDYGDIVYAMIEHRGEQVALFRGRSGGEDFEYFDADGKTNKRALMRTPLAYARISSNYGMRRHPIDGYRKMHKGVDFRASTGTPIVAAGDGVVDYVGRRGGYGKYIRVRHNRTYKTAYAHLSRYAKGLKPGARVKQGQVIGYVGSTGRSTGPHLHFEVLENGEQVNPMAVGDFGPIRSLGGADLARFKTQIARINIVLADLRPRTVVATVE